MDATGILEIEAFGDVWPAATATCAGARQRRRPAGRAHGRAPHRHQPRRGARGRLRPGLAQPLGHDDAPARGHRARARHLGARLAPGAAPGRGRDLRGRRRGRPRRVGGPRRGLRPHLAAARPLPHRAHRARGGPGAAVHRGPDPPRPRDDRRRRHVVLDRHPRRRRPGRRSADAAAGGGGVRGPHARPGAARTSRCPRGRCRAAGGSATHLHDRGDRRGLPGHRHQPGPAVGGARVPRRRGRRRHRRHARPGRGPRRHRPDRGRCGRGP